MMRETTVKRIISMLVALLITAASLVLYGEVDDTLNELTGESAAGVEAAPGIVEVDDTAAPSEGIEGSVALPENSPYEAFISAFTPADAPAYEGIPYTSVNNSLPLFCKADAARDAFEEYSELDGLGRCGVAFAKAGRELMPTEPRGAIGMVRPSGWHTTRYDDLIADHYLFNRCHLIAYQLTGENANPQNLITGTRYLNVEGMQPFENRVAAYINRSGNHVLYRVTPIFEGENLVASGVLMEAYSVEDNGAGICYNVFVYNVQPGIVIDYATGESERGETPAAVDMAEIAGYIGNIRSLKYHLPACPNLPQKQNWIIFSTEEEAEEQGYSPCGYCIGGAKADEAA